MEEGELPLVGLTEHSDHQWNEIRVQVEEREPDRIKNVVNPTDYEMVEVSVERKFYLDTLLEFNRFMFDFVRINATETTEFQNFLVVVRL